MTEQEGRQIHDLRLKGAAISLFQLCFVFHGIVFEAFENEMLWNRIIINWSALAAATALRKIPEEESDGFARRIAAGNGGRTTMILVIKNRRQSTNISAFTAANRSALMETSTANTAVRRAISRPGFPKRKLKDSCSSKFIT